MSVSLPTLPVAAHAKLGQIFLVVSLFLAILTGVLFKVLVLDRAAAAASSPVASEPVVVARATVPVGSTLTADDLKVVQWPAAYVPEGEHYESLKPLLGRVVRSELQAGEPVFRADLSGEASTGGLKVLIPKGLRAMTIAVSEIKGVAGFVKPGDRVDVVATFRNIDQDGNTRLELTKTVLQNILVIAAAQEMTEAETMQKPAPAANPNLEGGTTTQAAIANTQAQQQPAKLVTSVTLAVTPEQIEKLALADETGSVRLVLRPEEDMTISKSTGTTNQELYQVSLPSRNKARATAPASVSYAPVPMYDARVEGKVIEIIDGDQKSTIAF